jgi:hypothetical protein
MRIVLDTNVFISGIFFSSPPYRYSPRRRLSRDLRIVAL